MKRMKKRGQRFALRYMDDWSQRERDRKFLKLQLFAVNLLCVLCATLVHT